MWYVNQLIRRVIIYHCETYRSMRYTTRLSRLAFESVWHSLVIGLYVHCANRVVVCTEVPAYNIDHFLWSFLFKKGGRTFSERGALWVFHYSYLVEGEFCLSELTLRESEGWIS